MGNNHFMDEYSYNDYGWVEKKSFKGNPKTKEWDLTAITNRKYIDEKGFQKKQLELQKDEKRKLLFDLLNSISSYDNLSYWSNSAIKDFNSNEILTFKQFESLLGSNKPYICLNTDIVDKYKKETKKIVKDYQYSDEEPIEYQYFQVSWRHSYLTLICRSD